MKTILVVWIFYQSTFFRVGYSAVDVEVFNTPAECMAAAKIVQRKLVKNHASDEASISCESLPE